MKKQLSYYLLSFLVLGVVIYCYFLNWKIETINGDDLLVYQYYTGLTNFFQKINVSLYLSQKYRPVSSFLLHLTLICFKKDLFGYFIFNVVMQALSALLFLRIINLFIENKWIALLLSMVFAISRFSYYNASQLYNGGAMETPAMIFFLLTLFFLLKVFMYTDTSVLQKQKWLLWSIVFANICIYTHERYIVLFPFIALVVMLYKGLSSMPVVRKVLLTALCAGSVFMNFAIKEYIFSVPFFAGTGSTNIEFSLSSATSFYIDAILSILFINKGPEYLVGFQFTSLPLASKALTLFSLFCMAIVFFSFIAKSFRSAIASFISTFVEPTALKALPPKPQHASLSFFVLILFLLLLVPAVVTIRLEQRWLEASFSLFLLLIVIAMLNWQPATAYIKNTAFIALITALLFIDTNYLRKGIDNLFMRDAERSAFVFRNAINNGVIHPDTKNIYFMLPHRDANAENGFTWAVRDGYLFDYYQGKSKKIIFVDSVYERTISATDTTFAHFNKGTDQIVYTKGNVIDATDQYLQDSLRTFKFE